MGEFPSLILLPVTGLNFHDECSQILTFNFNATLWVIGTVFAGIGAAFYLADAVMSMCLAYGLGRRTPAVWSVIMFFVGMFLTCFVLCFKMIHIMRMGLSFAIGIKLEWLFKLQLWPVRKAVCLDLFQISAGSYFIFDKFFACVSGYLKYFAEDDEKKDMAGSFILSFFRGAQDEIDDADAQREEGIHKVVGDPRQDMEKATHGDEAGHEKDLGEGKFRVWLQFVGLLLDSINFATGH